jgi:hypothetical protein
MQPLMQSTQVCGGGGPQRNQEPPLTCNFQQVPAKHTELTDMQACARHRAWKDAALCSAHEHETACLIDKLLLSSVNMNM